MKVASLALALLGGCAALQPLRTMGAQQRGGASSRVARSAMPADDLIDDLMELAAFDLPAKLRRPDVLRQVATPTFFIRIAELCDATKSKQRREGLMALASNVQNTLSAIAQQADATLDNSASELQQVLTVAAEEDGEFLLPLSEEKRTALAAAVGACIEKGSLDENFLATLDAWAKKAASDNLDGVVSILRTVLQLYAATALRFDPEAAANLLQEMMPAGAADAPSLHPDYAAAAKCYAAVLSADADGWDAILTAALQPLDGAPATVQKRHLMAIVQAQIERVVLMQQNGTFKQQIQAEFLRELVQRIERNAPTGGPPEGGPDDLISAFLEADAEQP